MIAISFLLDGLFSLSNFTLVSLIVLSYYKKDILKYSLILGILYDIVYTNTLILNGVIYFIIIEFTYRFNNKKLLNQNILFLLGMFFYFTFTYFILIILNYTQFNFIYYLDSVLKFLIINLFYYLLLMILKHKKILNSYS